MTYKISEYDAFGPWIYVIDEEHTLPALFEPYKKSLDGALMSFKIPREIERRNANPEMHLYDAVISVFNTHILFLERQGDNVAESQIAIKDLIAIDNAHFLLLGKVRLYLENGVKEIKYSTVSVDIIEKFVDLLRSLTEYEKQELDLVIQEYNTETIDFLFAHLIDKSKKEDKDIDLVAYQPKYEMQTKKGFLGKLINKKVITCTAFLFNKKELVIINRSSPLDPKSKDDYAYTYSFIPIKNIQAVGIVKGVNGNEQSELHIKVFRHTFETVFNEGSVGIQELEKQLKR